MCSKTVWGYLRETAVVAKNAGPDQTTGLCRSGLDKYLRVIFPTVHDWVHNKGLPKEKNEENRKIRPDYRSESLNLIVEFDGLPHFQYPTVLTDLDKTRYYQRIGYRVVRIPYFIQLTRDAVKKYFQVDVACDLFDVRFPSLTGNGKWMPSHICPHGIMRMALEFVRFPDQYQVNKDSMATSDTYTGLDALNGLYVDFKQRYRFGIADPAELLFAVASGQLGLGGKAEAK